MHQSLLEMNVEIDLRIIITEQILYCLFIVPFVPTAVVMELHTRVFYF